MSPNFYREIAQRCRQLILQTQVEAVKEQLEFWAIEFEGGAVETEREPSAAAH